MFKYVAWPTALGITISIVTIILLQSNVVPGGERLDAGGMTFILIMGPVLGSLFGVAIGVAFGKKKK